MTLKPPRGLIIDLITPLESGGKIDHLGLEALINWVISYADGLMLGGPIGGEGLKIHERTRLSLVEYVLSALEGELPIFIWISFRDTEKTFSFSIAVKDIIQKTGYKGSVFFVDTPLYHHSNRGLFMYFNELCKKINFPFIIHNDPEIIASLNIPFKRKNIRTTILKELVTIDGIQGMVYCGPLERVRNYQKAIKKKSGFRIYDGEESKFLQHPSLSGVFSIGANILPRPWSRITHSSIEPGSENQHYPDQLKQIWEYGSLIQEAIRIYEKAPVYLIKQLLWKRGIIKGAFCFEQHINDKDDRLKRLSELIDHYMER